MKTDRSALLRALAKRGPSSEGWRWQVQPTPRERAAFAAFKEKTR